MKIRRIIDGISSHILTSLGGMRTRALVNPEGARGRIRKRQLNPKTITISTALMGIYA